MISTAITVMIAVSWNAWSTSGCVSVCVTLENPARTTVQKIAAQRQQQQQRRPRRLPSAMISPPTPAPFASGCVPAATLTRSSRAASASALVASTSTNEIANRKVATAAASANRNCDVKLKMNTGAVRVWPVRLPDTRITLPISPRHRENVSSVPANTAERIAGNTTRRNVTRRRRAERRGGLLLRLVELEQHGLHVAHDERQRDGAQRQDDRERREQHVDPDRASNALPSTEFGPYRTRIITPHTRVGIASGRSTTVESTRRPGNR